MRETVGKNSFAKCIT